MQAGRRRADSKIVKLTQSNSSQGLVAPLPQPVSKETYARKRGIPYRKRISTPRARRRWKIDNSSQVIAECRESGHSALMDVRIKGTKIHFADGDSTGQTLLADVITRYFAAPAANLGQACSWTVLSKRGSMNNIRKR